MQNTNVKRRLLSKNYNNTVYLKLGEKIKTQSRRSGGFFMSMEKLQKKKTGLDDKQEIRNGQDVMRAHSQQL